jgi:hypothetical protein
MSKPRAVFLDALSLGPVDLAPLERHAELICWPSTPPELRLERLQGAEIARAQGKQPSTAASRRWDPTVVPEKKANRLHQK